MKLNKLKVRPKKDAAAAPCAAEFATMLACWASSNDINNIGACKDSARSLQECMASRVSGSSSDDIYHDDARFADHTRNMYPLSTRDQKPRGGVSKPTINYHLARLSKQI
ncbi:hypothetical protein PANT_9c00089 [Moesziomyces antarcticus T-34]|uniref:Uncharacterized protein n=1 Tax=Pseudozyma antarctica (strain T-34) TaxID=1151754 RepID=M9MCA5_PSEA3|nr:hypothetical protein PANT_9c00089 [Moesziomyces antarcticus T-34]